MLAFAISIVIFASPHQDVRLGWLPWSNRTIGFWLFGSGLTGIALVILACARKVRFLLTIFALATAVLLRADSFSAPGVLAILRNCGELCGLHSAPSQRLSVRSERRGNRRNPLIGIGPQLDIASLFPGGTG